MRGQLVDGADEMLDVDSQLRQFGGVNGAELLELEVASGQLIRANALCACHGPQKTLKVVKTLGDRALRALTEAVLGEGAGGGGAERCQARVFTLTGWEPVGGVQP